jgi:hypothetical protein
MRHLAVPLTFAACSQPTAPPATTAVTDTITTADATALPKDSTPEPKQAIVCQGQKWLPNQTCLDSEKCQDGHCTLPAECKANSVTGCAGPTSQHVCTSDGKPRARGQDYLFSHFRLPPLRNRL